MYPSERLYANFLRKNKVRYKYTHLKEFFKLESGRYTPDFYLPDSNTYIEVVSTDGCFDNNERKYIEFKKTYKLKFVTPYGKTYVPRKNRDNKKIYNYRVPVSITVSRNLKREFQVTCVERGLKMKNVLEKLIVDFNRKNETKPLR